MEVDVPKAPVAKPVNPANVLEPQKPTVMKKFPDTKKAAKSNLVMVLIAFVVVGMGVLTGWFLSGTKASSDTKTGAANQSKNSDEKTASGEEGALDEEVKYGEVEGKLVEGGIKGEGTHHIERNNNPSQYAYLSSTVIDLDKYIDKNVHIWGETISSVNAPWLMDVVKIKIAE